MLLSSYIAFFWSSHYFMVSNENLGLQWSIEAIIILLCWILLPWDCSEVTYFCPENLLVLGRKIFENPLFMTYMHNMHIKWKLKTYQMQIRDWNCNLNTFLGEKSIFKNFRLNFQKKNFFEIKIFQKFSNTTPQNFFF